MFRVSISSDLPVFASKVFSSSAQARLGASATSAPELTHSVPNSTPAPCRNSRRLSPGVASPPTRMGCVNMVVSSLRKCNARRSASRVVAVTLQHLDLVSVWVLHEEEACDEPVAVAELLDVVGSQSQRLDARVLAREVIHAHGDVSIAGAVGVRLGASPVQGQLKLEIVLGIAQIDERKLGEIQAARRLQAERVAVETHGPVQVEDADHGVDHFRHSNLQTARKRETLCQIQPRCILLRSGYKDSNRNALHRFTERIWQAGWRAKWRSLRAQAPVGRSSATARRPRSCLRAKARKCCAPMRWKTGRERRSRPSSRKAAPPRRFAPMCRKRPTARRWCRLRSSAMAGSTSSTTTSAYPCAPTCSKSPKSSGIG